ncbi:radical SAM/SPASM domain-containing protein [Rhodocyclus gracilis]|uniref:radical SAM/SPASM domain-containing protein n=1 Tax=Rhodocyclus gracilis TaxID=2929842 RepID=UPI001E458208|nr:radical SAM protein [Rhodocyclus gracilis]
MTLPAKALTAAEQNKRNDLQRRKPYIAAKLAKVAEMEARGEVSPIIRLEKSYLCNFQCTHCSAEYYMDRHLDKVLKIVDTRQKIDLDDIRRLSREADELGLARFVITGGEPLVMKDFDAVVAAIDPEKHYVITDTNGWFLDAERARHLKSIGVEKVQLSLDSIIEEKHDAFRNKPGSYKRVMRAVDAALEAGLNLLLSTVLVKGQAQTEEFRELCRFAKRKGVGLYVSYAKPTGSCSTHPEFVIDKADADMLRELEKEYPVFSHMTPSYGSFKGCITVKGIITVTSTFEVTPCPYIDMSLGNLRETSLKEVLARGMRNPWLGPHRPDCIIGEDPQFITLHAEKTRHAKHLPIRWGEGFSDDATQSPTGAAEAHTEDVAPATATTTADAAATTHGTPSAATGALFDDTGRRRPPAGLSAPAAATTRRYFVCTQPALDYAAIHARLHAHLAAHGEAAPSLAVFAARADAILDRLRADPTTAPLLHGVHVPFFLPRAHHDDIGAALDTHYLPAVATAYRERFPDYAFVNHHKSPLAGTLSPTPGARHETLLAAMQAGDVVGYYFPCLPDFSLPAAVEQLGELPAQFLLAGGFDTAAALIGSPDLLLRRDGYPPLLWLAGLSAEAGEGYHFEAYGYNLTFNRRVHLGKSAEYWASGLVVLG